jgi:glutaredoxin
MAAVTDLPTVVLYSRPGCGLCDEVRSLLTGLLERRRAAGLPSPTIEERDIDSDPAWQRAYFTTIPVVELGEERLELVTSATALRRFLDDQLDR